MGQSPDFILKRDVKVVWVSISLETALKDYGNNVARQHAQQAAERDNSERSFNATVYGDAYRGLGGTRSGIYTGGVQGAHI